jgi:hypothetical protein
MEAPKGRNPISNRIARSGEARMKEGAL